MRTKARAGRGKKILIAIALVLLALLCVLAFVAGNFLFRFALDPTFSYSLDSLGSGGGMSAPSAPAERELTEDQRSWREYTAQARGWFDAEGQMMTLEREDGSVRRAVSFPAQGSHTYAIVCHGYYSTPRAMAGYAAMFRDMGMSVLAPYALAHGESDGRYIGMGWLEREDVLGWIDRITAEDPQAEIVLFGVSMGGATVMMAAGEDLPEQVKCIVEDCGYSSVWDEFSAQLKDLFGLPEFPLLYTADIMCRLRAGYGFKEASCVEQLKKARVPMLFLHGDKDTFVPYEMLDVVYEACASPVKEKLTIAGAVHGAAADTDPVNYWAAVEKFMGNFVHVEME